MGNITEEQIDRAADALRRLRYGFRVTRPWGDLSATKKRKWREVASVALVAALNEKEPA